MSYGEPIICDHCKNPIYRRSELVVAPKIFFFNLKKYHSKCFDEAEPEKIILQNRKIKIEDAESSVNVVTNKSDTAPTNLGPATISTKSKLGPVTIRIGSGRVKSRKKKLSRKRINTRKNTMSVILGLIIAWAIGIFLLVNESQPNLLAFGVFILIFPIPNMLVRLYSYLKFERVLGE